MQISDYAALIREGLPKTTRPRNVVIVGAGMAGLVAGFELLRAGHDGAADGVLGLEDRLAHFLQRDGHSFT